VRRRRSAPAVLASSGASPLRYNWPTGNLGGRLSDRLVRTRVKCYHKRGLRAPFSPR
jgi:hypothetical protein